MKILNPSLCARLSALLLCATAHAAVVTKYSFEGYLLDSGAGGTADNLTYEELWSGDKNEQNHALGQRCDIERVGRGDYRVRTSDAGESMGTNWVEWLLACQEKGWLGEPDRSELTSLQPPAHFSE